MSLPFVPEIDTIFVILNISELFMLFADYAQNFKTSLLRFAYTSSKTFSVVQK